VNILVGEILARTALERFCYCRTANEKANKAVE
jgi:hypothetical protein